ncbi:phosphoribosyl-ATP pyrophosphatase [Rhizobiales bacterium GAS191]|jgi:phosphoribosyl-ATP pyrophosphohydrolase|nr:phosphoribosyl-ATP pyrophosphatase [Rhizobiales bacterium GAS113]SEC15192.1 phosphoribosyl-ATP pyrophosphatase [Rhizobiales bacterium GAS191]SED05771.1 phosphoribosyl-ATP pyrophosphatase [Rhizobiales bacterium GAS188]
MASRFTLADLERVIAERSSASPEDSWTAKLLSKGPSRVAKKLGEEAVETVIAAVENDKAALIGESADLLYHLLVVLRSRGVLVQDVLDELQRRGAQSGLAEKAARGDS